MILQEKIEPIYYLHFHWISGQIVPIFRLQGLYNELLASSLIVRIVFRVSSPLTIRGNKVFQVSQGWTFDHMGAVSVILGSMEGVSWHGFRDESSNTYRLVALIVRVSSAIVINKKKVFEQPLHHTRRKNRADLVVEFSTNFMPNSSYI